MKFKVSPPNAIRTTAKAFGQIQIGGPTDVFTTVGLLAYDATGTILTANLTGSAGTFSDIAHTADYTIDWRIESGTTIFQAGTSKNPAHWVLLAPTGNFTLFYSLIDIGCRHADGMNTQGPSDDVAIANAIFGEFADRNVLRSSDVLEGIANPVPMTYWENWWFAQPFLEPIDLSPGLLAYGDGRCGAWAEFFIRCLHAVGIDPPYESIEVELPPIPNVAQVLMVPDWNVSGQSNVNGHLGGQYPSINIPDDIHGDPTYFVSQHQYNWQMSDCDDLDGVPAQGQLLPHTNPSSLFLNHGIVRVWATNYFDPSYGTTHTSVQSVDNAFQAFGRLYGAGMPGACPVDEGHVSVDLDGDGSVTPGNIVWTDALIIQPNPAGTTEVQLDPGDWSR